ncbi:hypothetical protein [Pseudoalteromonas sp. R3]|uniref:hypothetical protein n=1 Tax=Pseudoalteromonas sp. R3 TaxID=1709477 RepID=UPI0006B4EE30|nr:hypothetical protein [Pseudoalteromonas sp. R3]AZZ97982.1 hypothetical protein ELR70_13185 [Pseudoalteromonas sp. R3]
MYNTNRSGSHSGTWRVYELAPPFDGLYEARARESTNASLYSVINGTVIDKDGDTVLNFSCEWRFVRSLTEAEYQV